MKSLARLLFIGSACLKQSQLLPITSTPLLIQERFAGHSKWQNIRHTKAANDAARAKIIAKHTFNIVKAISLSGQQADPKLNSDLAKALELARRDNVPKDTIERAIKRATSAKLVSTRIELLGPNQVGMVLDITTDNKSRCRQDIKAIVRKFKSWQMARSDTAVHYFTEKAYIRVQKTDRNGQPISFEQIEEIAIEAEAEEVVENVENEDASPPSSANNEGSAESQQQKRDPAWVLRLQPADIYRAKGYLEKEHPRLIILEYNTELLPLHQIELSENEFDEFQKLHAVLESNEEVNCIYANVA